MRSITQTENAWRVNRLPQLGRLSEILKLDLSQARVALPGLTLKRVEPLQFENRPLAQLLIKASMVLSYFAS